MGAMTPTTIGKGQPLCTCGLEDEHLLFEHDRRIRSTGGTGSLPAVAPQDVELHPSTQQILRWFTFEYLPEGPLRDVASILANHAGYLAAVLPQGPELTTGLRKLLEAKDCFVRAALDLPKDGA